MKRIKVTGLALVAVFAVSAVAAASALAVPVEPVWKLANTAEKQFTGSSGQAVLSTANTTVTCTSSVQNAGEGEVVASGSSTVAKVTIHFLGCKSGTKKCKSTSPVGATEEIITNVLKGALGYVHSKAEREANMALTETGLDLSPETAASFAEFKCETLGTNKVTGDVDGLITPVDTPVKVTPTQEHFTLTYETTAPGKQKVTSLYIAGALDSGDHLTAELFGFTEEAAEAATGSVFPKTETEIVA